MPNVLVDLHRTGGNAYNGLFHFCYHLGVHLAKSVPDDMDFHFYVPRSHRGFFGNNVNYVNQYSLHKYYHPGARQFDVWHIATTLSWYRPFGNKTKSIYTIHDLNFMNEEEFTLESKNRYKRLIQQRIDRADHLTFISGFSLQQAKDLLNLGNKPCTIIYNGCNIPEHIDDNARPGYSPVKPFLFSIGQLHPRKNFHVLPALLEGNDYELIIAGLNDFPYTDRVWEEARKHNVLDRVKLIGPVSEEEKHFFYKNCLAFVFPSLGEGFGLPVIEAMYFGKPVFLCTHGSLPEVGGEYAYYFNDFDPQNMRDVFERGMQHYCNSKPALAIMQWAKHFNWDIAAQQYTDLYRALAK